MSKAENFLVLFEGFKLGSLGVSKNPKVVAYAPEVQQKKDDPDIPIRVWGFERVATHDLISKQYLFEIKWLQTINPKLVKGFGINQLENNPLPSVRIGLMAKKYNTRHYVLSLNIFYENLQHHTRWLGYVPKDNLPKTKQTFLAWLTITLPEVEKDGLKALEFPEKWVLE